MRIELIRPSRSFRDAEEVVAFASGLHDDLALLHSMDLQVLPVILDETGLPLDLPNQFITSVAILRPSATGDTPRTYAECLLCWLRFLESKSIEIRDVTEETLAAFRNSLSGASGPDGVQVYTANTINLRVTVVESFYGWMHSRRALLTPLGEFVIARNLQRLPYRSENSNRIRSLESLLVPKSDTLPRPLGFEEISRLFAITPQPFRLMFRWGLATGLRRFEVINLRISRLMSPEQISSSGLDPVPVDIVRKGGKTATIYAPAALVEETQWYCLVDRPVVKDDGSFDFVFLNRNGRSYSPGTLSRTFRKYANMIGSSATLHHLRHSFAILTLGYLESLESKGKKVNPVKIVQTLLGHSNVTTTEVYLRTLEVSSDEVREALAFLYGSTL